MNNKVSLYVLISICLVFYSSCLNLKQTTFKATYRKLPSKYYTQGMFFSDDGKYLYISSGLYGSSFVSKLDYSTLNPVKTLTLADKYFGEGFARCGNYIYLLTWKERTIFKFNYPDMSYIGSLGMDARIQEGWGLATLSSTELIASDGTSNIYVLDCNNYLLVKRIIRVTLNGSPLKQLNALEFANGMIWANVYFSNYIYVINPTTGVVTKSYNMTSLVNFELNNYTLSNSLLQSGNVLNGIAYNKVGKYFLITGKLWGYVYQVTFS